MTDQAVLDALNAALVIAYELYQEDCDAKELSEGAKEELLNAIAFCEDEIANNTESAVAVDSLEAMRADHRHRVRLLRLRLNDKCDGKHQKLLTKLCELVGV